MTRRSSSGTTRTAPATDPAGPATEPVPGPVPPPPTPPVGNGLLVLFGIVVAIFGVLSGLELRGGRAGPVFGATVFVGVLVVVLAAFYKAGLLARRPRPIPPSPSTPPQRDKDEPGSA